MNDRLYYRELNCYEEEQKHKQHSSHTYVRAFIDLSTFPTEGIKKQMRDFFIYQSNNKKLTCGTIRRKAGTAKRLGQFFTAYYPATESARTIPEETLLLDLKRWLMANNLPLFVKQKSPDGKNMLYKSSPLICLLKAFVVFLIQTEDVSEEEKDIWTLENFPFPIRQNPTSIQNYLDFRKIPQPAMRSEVKQACRLFLSHEALRTIENRILAASKMAVFFQKTHPEINSFTQLTRVLVEEYLIYLRTNCSRNACCSAQISLLKTLTEEIGKITQTHRLEHLFLSSDNPTRPSAMYRTYSEEELSRIHECIVKLPPQYARVMLIHELLGTRISDTLTLKQDALEERDGRWILRIDQVKSQHSYKKPVNQLLVDLLKASIRYTQAQFPDSPYVFADETDPMRPVPYSFLMKMLRSVYKENDLRNDNGAPMCAETHIFRKMYGQRLTDMDIDDAIIATLLGHSSTASVKFYRKTSYKKLAKESKKLRDHMDAILSEIIKDW